jgi:predicted  nucleic acid-binding Zn-ribbon protein
MHTVIFLSNTIIMSTTTAIAVTEIDDLTPIELTVITRIHRSCDGRPVVMIGSRRCTGCKICLEEVAHGGPVLGPLSIHMEKKCPIC